VRRVHLLDYVVKKIGIRKPIKEHRKIIALPGKKIEEQAIELGGVLKKSRIEPYSSQRSNLALHSRATRLPRFRYKCISELFFNCTAARP